MERLGSGRGGAAFEGRARPPRRNGIRENPYYVFRAAAVAEEARLVT